MKISVKVKANSKSEKIEKTGENQYNIWVKAPAQEGRANQAVVESLSSYFDIPRSRINILKGEKNKNKLIEII